MNGLALIGLKSSGKSHHSLRLGDYLRVPVFDLDDCILKSYPTGKSIRQLYIERGEKWFRQAELDAFHQLPKVDKFSILATGGGSMENRELMTVLKQQAILLVFIDTPETFLLERMKKKGFPPFISSANPESSFHELYEHRHSLARELADVHIEAGNRSKDELFAILKKSLEPYVF